MNVTENHSPNQVLGVISSGEYSFSHLLAFFSSSHTRPNFRDDREGRKDNGRYNRHQETSQELGHVAVNAATRVPVRCHPLGHDGVKICPEQEEARIPKAAIHCFYPGSLTHSPEAQFVFIYLQTGIPCIFKATQSHKS